MGVSGRKVEASPVTDAHRRAMREGKPISTLIPIHLANGGVVDELTMNCARCDQPLPDQDTRACVQVWPNGTHVLRGYGVCRGCRMLTPLVTRFHSDGRWVHQHGDSPSGWVEGDVSPAVECPAWWDLAGWFRRMLH
jgi:hypothetical protein